MTLALVAFAIAPLEAPDGSHFDPTVVGPKRLSVMYFVLADCPIARKFSPEIQRLAKEFTPRGVAFTMVHTDPSVKSSEMVTHAKEFGIKFAIGADRKQTLTKRYGVLSVPTADVVDSMGKVVYFGRIDDRFPALGVQKAKPSRHDLRLAITQTLSGQPVAVPRTTTIGCAVPPLN